MRMRRLSPRTRAWLTCQVTNLFFKAEQGEPCPGSGEQASPQHHPVAMSTGETQSALHRTQAEFLTINTDLLAEAMKEIY